MVDSTFESNFRAWVVAACKEWGYPPPSRDWFERAERRLPAGLRRTLELGLADGVVQVVAGYRFRLDGLAAHKGPYAFFSRFSQRRQPGPNWEYFVQVAEYVRIRRAVRDPGYRVSFEDELMDISVRDGHDRLVWCMEVKERADQLDPLLVGILRYASGVDPGIPDRHNDPLRKAKYLLRARPDYFSLMAVGKRIDFQVVRLGSDRFELTPDVIPLG
jgi:hypothetical protein